MIIAPNWPHPDAAWSPYYMAPDGLPNEPHKHVPSEHCRVGPTSRRKSFMIGVKSCSCGRIMRSYEDITWREYFWVRRWNEKHV